MKNFLGIFLAFLTITSTYGTQDYFRLRNNPDVFCLLGDKKIPIGSKEVHERLQANVAAVRKRFDSDKTTSKWQQQKGTRGNLAGAVVQLIYSDGTEIQQHVVSKKGTEYFTTITIPGTSSYDVSDLGNSFRDLITPLTKINFYPDTEAQIADVVFFTPMLAELIKRQQKPLLAIIVHIYTELDPCDNCRILWSTISEKMNKSGVEWILQRIEKVNTQLQDCQQEKEKINAQLASYQEQQSSGINCKSLIQAEKQKLKQKEQTEKDLTKFMQRTEGLYDALKPLRGRLKSVRFITEISSINEYGDARTACVDEFNCLETDQFPSILNLPLEEHVLISPIEKLSMLPAPYCVFTHFLDHTPTHKRIKNIPGMQKSLMQILLEELFSSSRQTGEKVTGGALAAPTSSTMSHPASQSVQPSHPVGSADRLEVESSESKEPEPAAVGDRELPVVKEDAPTGDETPATGGLTLATDGLLKGDSEGDDEG